MPIAEAVFGSERKLSVCVFQRLCPFSTPRQYCCNAVECKRHRQQLRSLSNPGQKLQYPPQPFVREAQSSCTAARVELTGGPHVFLARSQLLLVRKQSKALLGMLKRTSKISQQPKNVGERTMSLQLHVWIVLVIGHSQKLSTNIQCLVQLQPKRSKD